jgi:hypothetical protein
MSKQQIDLVVLSLDELAKQHLKSIQTEDYGRESKQGLGPKAKE